jgi:hypothetical protein
MEVVEKEVSSQTNLSPHYFSTFSYLNPSNGIFIAALVQQVDKGLNASLGQKVAKIRPGLVAFEKIVT